MCAVKQQAEQIGFPPLSDVREGVSPVIPTRGEHRCSSYTDQVTERTVMSDGSTKMPDGRQSQPALQS